jgi:enoyl-[acyl-carrier protein] reductase II
MEGRNHDTHINTNGKGKNSNTINCCRRDCNRSRSAAMTLGADGVQMGVGLWLLASLRHILILKIQSCKLKRIPFYIQELAPVRLIKNKFYQDVQDLYATCPTKEELIMLGKSKS